MRVQVVNTLTVLEIALFPSFCVTWLRNLSVAGRDTIIYNNSRSIW